MSGAAPAFRIAAIDCFEQPVRYRMPFRFGAATVDAGMQAFVRARIHLTDGRESEGAAAELMVPKWFDKDPDLSGEDNVEQLRRALTIARAVYLEDGRSRTAFGHFAAHGRACREEGQRRRLPALVAAFGPAEIDKAILDALCRALGISFYDAIVYDRIGFAPDDVAPDIAGADASAFLGSLSPQAALRIRHTVGMADTLCGHPAHLNDGLPESLEEAITRYGLRAFKVKLGGDPATDLARLRDIASVLDALPDYRVTLDCNEQYEPESLQGFLRTLRADASLRRLAGAVLFVEQPLPRRQTFEVDVRPLSAGFPMLADEADAAVDDFPRTRGRGYAGVSSKSCKGVYKSLVNALRCAVWDDGAFLSAEDLTTPPGLAVQQDLALASILGISHVERNAYHYLAGAPGREQAAILACHSALYASSRLAVRDGVVAIGSFDCTGFASGALPDWSGLTGLRSREFTE
jgi:hypothetical protein